MRRLLPTLVFISLFAVAAPAQGSCPTVTVEGPAGVPRIGDLIAYTAKVDTKGSSYVPQFRWIISTGEIVSGQGTNSITVRPPTSGLSVTATVDLLGLPDGCEASASETMSGPNRPEPFRVGRVQGIETLNSAMLAKFVEELTDNPNNQGYIIVGHPVGTTLTQISAREKAIRDAVRKADPASFDNSRVTITSVEKAADTVEFWRVPPGADNPKCETCHPQKPSPCPTLSIAGPLGIPNPGETITYRALLKGEVLSKIEYRWYVTTGSIIKGQGTAEMTVGKDWAESRRSLTVTVEIHGLPPSCPNNFSETLAV